VIIVKIKVHQRRFSINEAGLSANGSDPSLFTLLGANALVDKLLKIPVFAVKTDLS